MIIALLDSVLAFVLILFAIGTWERVQKYRADKLHDSMLNSTASMETILKKAINL